MPVIKSGAMNPTEIQLFGFNFFLEFDSGIDCFKFYFAYFRSIPSVKMLKGIDLKRLEKWLETQSEFPILKKHFRQSIKKGIKDPELMDTIYLLENEIIIYLEPEGLRVLFSEKSEAESDYLV